jgi:hypothetical protein
LFRCSTVFLAEIEAEQLQSAYGQAMMLSCGFGAEETLAAFTGAQELSTGGDNSIRAFRHPLWALGLGCAKTKSDLVAMPSGRQISPFFCPPHHHRAQNSGCDYTA